MHLFNTLTRKLEIFKPLVDNQVKIYVCGITPYDTTHLGHAFTYICFDVLVRSLTYIGYNVTYTQNVTDINDRDTDILKRAKEENVTWDSLAKHWTKRFLLDMKALNWRMPDNYLNASEHIPTMIKLIEKLLKNGIAYKKQKNIFLDVKKIKQYGLLSRLTRSEMLEIAKQFEEDLQNPLKRNKLDITLWKAKGPNQPPHIPSFDSPFGRGRPGWHIECSAMAICSLAEQIDLHGGGEDLIYPHHESEIAQSEGATGKVPFAKFWIHTGSVSYRGEKMSKSVGNLVLVSDLLKKYSSNTIRFMLLSHHYQKTWEFTYKEMEQAQKSMEEIESFLLSREQDEMDQSVLKKFSDTMNNNLRANEYIRWITENLKNFSEKHASTIYTTFTALGFTF